MSISAADGTVLASSEDYQHNRCYRNQVANAEALLSAVVAALAAQKQKEGAEEEMDEAED